MEIIELLPFVTPVIFLGFILYFLWKSNFLKKSWKLSKEAPDLKTFYKIYFGVLSKQVFMIFAKFIIKYTIYIALYGFIFFNIYNMMGFEIAVIFGIVLILSRIQIKDWTVVQQKPNNINLKEVMKHIDINDITKNIKF